MGGGGSGGFSGGSSSTSYRELIDESRQGTEASSNETEINEKIKNILSSYNNRDSEEHRSRLDEIRSIVTEEIEGSVELKFGGSVSKHTYCDGLSDVDVLMYVHKTELADLSPREVLEFVKNKLAERGLKNVKEIRTGQLAVTVVYNDDTEIQVLPAIKRGAGVKIPSAKGNEWSSVIRPDKFAEKLTEVNQKWGGNVVPVIKLAKVINSNLPEDQQLTGYHIESMAIEAFKNYPADKPSTPKIMLKHFYEKSIDTVNSNIKDKTGQSIHVDDYLGPENSAERLRRSYALKRVYQKMEDADKIGSKEEWGELLSE